MRNRKGTLAEGFNGSCVTSLQNPWAGWQSRLDTSWKQGRSEGSGMRIQEKLVGRVACQDSPTTGMSRRQTFAAFSPDLGQWKSAPAGSGDPAWIREEGGGPITVSGLYPIEKRLQP